jgi:ferrous iron transport protein A
VAAPSQRPRPVRVPQSPPTLVASGEPVALADLEPGQEARVCAVDGDGPEARRLQDLGFVPGTAVRVLERAPLGDPTVYRLRGTSLCLRRSEALRIAVRPA